MLQSTNVALPVAYKHTHTQTHTCTHTTAQQYYTAPAIDVAYNKRQGTAKPLSLAGKVAVKPDASVQGAKGSGKITSSYKAGKFILNVVDGGVPLPAGV